jgi:hypothetical protein
MKVEVGNLQENLNVSPGLDLANANQDANDLPKDVILSTVDHKDRVINRQHDNNETLTCHIADLQAEIGDKDLQLMDDVEAIHKSQSEIDCELLKDALSQYANDLNVQHEISDRLAADKKRLQGTIVALQKRQAGMEDKLKKNEQKAEEREDEWHARAELLLREVDRRGAACMQLWGELEHPEKQMKRQERPTSSESAETIFPKRLTQSNRTKR